MRSPILLAVGVVATSVVAAVAFAGTASAGVPGAAPARKASCYNVTQQDSGISVLSDDFTDSGLSSYDASAALDFSLTKPCTMKDVWTTGVYLNGAGPADSVSVILYKPNKHGDPGRILKKELNLAYADPTGTGSLRANGEKIRLKKGSYWISVVATMDFASGGEWGWELSSGVVGLDDVWENPAGGLGTPCTTWASISDCLGVGGDLMARF